MSDARNTTPDIYDRAKALGVDLALMRIETTDEAGQIIILRRYKLVLRDATHGNTVVRQLDAAATDEQILAECASMRAEASERAKQTRIRISAERKAARS